VKSPGREDGGTLTCFPVPRRTSRDAGNLFDELFRRFVRQRHLTVGRVSFVSRLFLDDAQHSQGLVEVRVKVRFHHIHDLPQEFVAQAIEDLIAFFSRDHEVLAAEDGQVLGGVGLLDAKCLMDAPHRYFPLVAKQLNDGDASRVGQRLKYSGFEVAKGVVHIGLY
jgi:hypothetical protein